MSKISVEDLQKIIAGATERIKAHTPVYGVFSDGTTSEADLKLISTYPAALLVIALAKEALENVWYSEFSNNETCMEGKEIKEALSAIEAFENEVTG